MIVHARLDHSPIRLARFILAAMFIVTSDPRAYGRCHPEAFVAEYACIPGNPIVRKRFKWPGCYRYGDVPAEFARCEPVGERTCRFRLSWEICHNLDVPADYCADHVFIVRRGSRIDLGEGVTDSLRCRRRWPPGTATKGWPNR